MPSNKKKFLQFFIFLKNNDLFKRTLAQLVLPPLTVVVLFFLFGFGLAMPSLERYFQKQTCNVAQDIASPLLEHMEQAQEQVRQGKKSLKEIQEHLLEHLNSFHFGAGGYPWVIDDKGNVIVSPFWGNMHAPQDPKEAFLENERHREHFIHHILNKALAEGEGCLSYEDQSQGNEKRTSYFFYFQPWGWIVGIETDATHIDKELREWRKQFTEAGFFLTLIAGTMVFVFSLQSIKSHKKEREALHQLEERKTKLRAIFNSSPHGIGLYRCPQDGNSSPFIEANAEMSAIFGRSIKEILTMTPVELGILESAKDCLETWKSLQEEKTLRHVPLTIEHPSGKERHLLCTFTYFHLEEDMFVLLSIQNITERESLVADNRTLQKEIQHKTISLEQLDFKLQKRQKSLQRTQDQMVLMNKIFQHTSEGICITDKDYIITFVNTAYTTITGYTISETLGQKTYFLHGTANKEINYVHVRQDLEEKQFWEGDFWFRHRSGKEFPVNLSITRFLDKNGKPDHHIMAFRDISEIYESRSRLKHETLHDSLTELPNRQLFLYHLLAACKKAEEAQTGLVVAHFGLDRFNNINKSMGYAVGDAILVEAAIRMREILANKGELARFGGDEFTLFIPFGNGVEMQESLKTVEKLVHSIRHPFNFENQEIRLTISAGVSTYPEDALTPEGLIQNASLALGRAKEESRNWYQRFTKNMDEEMQTRRRTEGELHKGIENKEFLLYYQPKVDIATERVVGMEGLLRWNHPERGVIMPGIFIPLAEELGEINTLGQIALAQACSDTRAWNLQGYPLRVAVNVSAQQFTDPNFIYSILHTIEEAYIDPTMVELEITESAFMEDLPKAVRIMSTLKKEGILFSLDDFGTGHSSLSYIHHLPLGGIKMDKSLVQDLHMDTKNRASVIISTLVFMAQELDLQITAEGVETPEQLQFIRTLGDHIIIQGFYYARPMPGEDFLKYVKENSLRS